jgi:hypothetical protein
MAEIPLTNQSKYTKLRKDFPEFIFNSFTVEKENDAYVLKFHFIINETYSFKPEHIIPVNKHLHADNLSGDVLQSLAFHIGMVELISYWKSACPPLVVIKPFRMSDSALAWWKKLYFHGLGEFFYLNGIDAGFDDFMTIRCDSDKNVGRFKIIESEKCIVPVGGGKDSAVTLEILKKTLDVVPFVVNPRGASVNTILKSGISNDNYVFVSRSIDINLLKMNESGFLNGHTPFSAILAFESLFVGYLTGISSVALSNESSANESTVPGSEVNHQYSKSHEFESDFRWYVKQFLCDNFNYFSFLRPLDELQIALLFSRFPSHHSSFRSCNAGSKTDSWCGKCSKCLFTWIILSPFIHENKLTEIFGKNLFQDESLINELEQLCGLQDIKPFECVGTRNEVILALDASMERMDLGMLPALLLHYSSKRNLLRVEGSFREALENTSENNFLNKYFSKILMKELEVARTDFYLIKKV